jgi:protein-disulfide isomerase
MATTPNGNNPWFASTMGLAGLIIGYVIATGVNGLSLPIGGVPAANNNPTAAAPTPVAPAPTTATPPELGDSPFLGKADAPVSVLEFTDFQCPFCQRHFQQTFGDIKKNYIDTGKIKYYLKHFPLGFHPNAQKASETVACANEQGKNWEMHEKIFNTQSDWQGLDATAVSAKFKEYAKDVGLNAGTFATCLDTGATAEAVKADQAAGSASGIDGTPGFWILGPNDQKQLISGAYPFATFQAAIDGMLK